MRRLGTALLLAAVLVGAAGASAPVYKVLAVEWKADGGQLRWVSAVTLRPVGGPSVNVAGAPVGLTAVSPDGGTAALGGGEGGRLRLVDLRRLRSVALLRIGEGFVSEGIWPARDRLVLLLGATGAEVAVVDPVARQVVSRRALSGRIIASGAAGGRIVALLGPRDSIGVARLAVVEPSGSVRTIELPGIRAGLAPSRTRTGTGSYAMPGLAASSDALRAAIVSLDRVLEVDLETLRVRSRRLVTRTTSRAAKRLTGWSVGAVWTSGDTVAVTGSTEAYANGIRTTAATGLRLLDVRSGQQRLLDASATGASLVGRTLVASGGTALRGYGLDGAPRWELVDGVEDSGYIQRARRYLYVGSTNSTRFVVVDAEDGRIVGRASTTKPTVILGP